MDCHSSHVEYDATATGGDTVPNVFLVRRYPNFSSATQRSKRIVYNDVSSKKFANAAGSGVCQSCHNPPASHNFVAGVPDDAHKACAGCHNHNEVTGSWSPGAGGGCTSCHGQPPVSSATAYSGYTKFDETTTPHITHAGAGTNYSFACAQCHSGNTGHGTGTYQTSGTTQYAAVFVTTAGTLSPAAAYNAGTSTCITVYCHSNGAGGYKASPTWGSNKVGTATCSSCHDAVPTTGSHTKHAATFAYGCDKCHASTTSNGTTITNKANHVNGVKDVLFSGSLPSGGALSGSSCSAVYCHSNGKSVYSASAPTWGGAAACGSCHATAVAPGGYTNSSHATHFTVLTDTANTSCATCHIYTTDTASTHVNGTINLQTVAASCATCHADPYSTSVVTPPTWGTSNKGCNACHSAYPITATGPVTGSHAKHNDTSCGDCHATATNYTTMPTSNHANTAINVSNGYPVTAKHAAGTYSGSCSSASCHFNPYGTGVVPTPVWGVTATNCTACHSAYPINAYGPNTGGHALAGHSTSNASGCVACHNTGTSATSIPATGHANGSVNVVIVGYTAGTSIAKHAAGTGYSTCSTASCHASPYGTTTVTTLAWGSTGAGCNACHSAYPFAATGPATGSHAKHNDSNCADCHTGATNSSTIPSANHANGTINVAAGYPVTAKHAAGTYSGSCSAAFCHSDPYGTGTVPTPTWGATAANCTACHIAYPISATGPATGSHAKHNDTNCADCHTGATNSITIPSSNHANGTINVAAGYPVTAKHAAGTYSGSCSSASCHFNPYGTGTVPTPTWGATAANCTACHSAYPITAVSGPATGSHAVHNDGNCANCHAGATNYTTVPSANHANGSINVSNGYPVTAKHTAVTYTGSCSTATCHGSSSPIWGANTTNATCTKCHGTATPASTGITAANRFLVAPNDTTATTDTSHVSTIAKTGAHQAHLQLFKGFTNYSTVDYRCNVCHSAANLATMVGSHASGSAAAVPVFSGMANRNGITSTYNATTRTCSTYCHNPAASTVGMDPLNAPAATTVQWNDTAYITGTAKSLVNCQKCHLVPGSTNFTKASVHTGITTDSSANQCNSCHGHNGDNTGVLGQRHMDGTRYAQGASACNGCHDYDTVGTAPNTTWGTEKNANYGGNGEGIGAHAKHIDYLKSRWGVTLNATSDYTAGFATGNALKVCNTCHTKTGHQTGTAVHITFGDAPGTLTFGTSAQTLMFGSSNPTYTGVPQTSSATNAKTCSNISCHYFTTPLWSSY
jgi:predicted CxxxxCH...CXXCH cytochrome family protein